MEKYDEETVSQVPTQEEQQNNKPMTPALNSNTQGGRRHKYRLKNYKFMVNSVASDFFGEIPELGVVIELFLKRIDKKLSSGKFLEKLKTTPWRISNMPKMSCTFRLT